MTHPMNIAPPWREQDVPPECPVCGGAPHSPCPELSTTPKEAPRGHQA